MNHKVKYIIKNRKNVLFGLMYYILFNTLIILIYIAPVFSAPPSPHAFSGIIFYPNGSQVEQGTEFIIKDLTNDFILLGKTGRGPYPGAYAVSVDGNDGDNISFFAHTQTNYDNITFLLSQSMYNVDLILNSQYPNSPPKIISTPITIVNYGDNYTYLIQAEDGENNIRNYNLLESPSNMVLNNNALMWIPDVLGNISVKIRVYDIFNEYDEQSFNVYVNGTITTTTTTTTQTTIPSGSSQGSSSAKIYNSSGDNEKKYIITPKPHLNPNKVTQIIPSYTVVGYVYISDGKHQVPRGTELEIINLNNGVEINTETGLGPYPGAYSIIISGSKGDILRFIIDDKTYDFVLYGDMQQDIITNIKGTDIDITKMSLDDLYYSDKKDVVFAYPYSTNNTYWGIFYIVLVTLLIMSYKILKRKKEDDLFD